MILTSSVLVLLYHSHKTVVQRVENRREEQSNKLTRRYLLPYEMTQSIFLFPLNSVVGIFSFLMREQHTGSITEERKTSTKSFEVLSSLTRLFNRFVFSQENYWREKDLSVVVRHLASYPVNADIPFKIPNTSYCLIYICLSCY